MWMESLLKQNTYPTSHSRPLPAPQIEKDSKLQQFTAFNVWPRENFFLSARDHRWVSPSSDPCVITPCLLPIAGWLACLLRSNRYLPGPQKCILQSSSGEKSIGVKEGEGGGGGEGKGKFVNDFFSLLLLFLILFLNSRESQISNFLDSLLSMTICGGEVSTMNWTISHSLFFSPWKKYFIWEVCLFFHDHLQCFTVSCQV